MLKCGVATNFNDLLTMLKREVIADDTMGAQHDDAHLLSMLYDSSVEIAATLGFPQDDFTASVSGGAASIPIPADLAITRINQVRIGPYNLRIGSPVDVLRKSQYLAGGPAVYEFDPRVRDPLRFAPPMEASRSFPAEVRYTRDLSVTRQTYTATSQPWEGLFRGWWPVIVLHAGDKAVRSEGDLERASVFQQRYQMQLLSFGKFLGLPSDEMGLVELQARRDTAAQVDNPARRIDVVPQVEERR